MSVITTKTEAIRNIILIAFAIIIKNTNYTYMYKLFLSEDFFKQQFRSIN